jgi:hypothetical protein
MCYRGQHHGVERLSAEHDADHQPGEFERANDRGVTDTRLCRFGRSPSAGKGS